MERAQPALAECWWGSSEYKSVSVEEASPQSTLLCRRASSINRGRADQMDVASVVAESKGAVGVNTLTSALGGAGKMGGLPFHRESACHA